MTRRQSMPGQWLMVDRPLDTALRRAVRRLQPRSGLLLVGEGSKPAAVRTIRRLAASKRLMIADEASGQARRVHNPGELRSALLSRTPLILLSPLYPTASHPDWPPLPRMRAAALARLAGRRLLALGGMDAKRYARIKRLGFSGWAGISAFRT